MSDGYRFGSNGLRGGLLRRLSFARLTNQSGLFVPPTRALFSPRRNDRFESISFSLRPEKQPLRIRELFKAKYVELYRTQTGITVREGFQSHQKGKYLFFFILRPIFFVEISHVGSECFEPNLKKIILDLFVSLTYKF